MKKGSLIAGIVLVIIFVILSVILISLPCSPYYVVGGFFGSVCQNDIWFTIINLPGAIIIKLISGSNPYESIIIKLVSIIVNIPIYFFIGFLIGKIFSKRR